MERDNDAMQNRVKKMNDLRIEMEAELELVSRRLEAMDPQFRLERMVFRKIVQHFKSRRISMEHGFSVFDRNRDGRISRSEFRSALDNMGVSLTGAEIETLMRSIDTDLDGNVRYLEFTRKCKFME